MDSLCQAVRSEVAKAFEGEPVTDWEFTSAGPDSCAVRSANFLVSFTLDPRNGLVSSSITFLDAAEEHREDLQSHVLSRMFPEIRWNPETHSGPTVNRIAVEVDNVRNILQSVKNGNLSPRDLFYFHGGYSCGYTDSVSMNE